MATKNVFSKAGADDSDDLTPLPVQKKAPKKDDVKKDQPSGKGGEFVPKMSFQQKKNLQADGFEVEDKQKK